MPASRSARAMTLAPRSCPSSPGLAIRTRILGAVESMALPQPQRYEEHKGRHEGAWSEHGGFFIFPPDLAQRVAHLAERGVRAGGLEDRVHQVARAAGGLLQRAQRRRDPLLVARRLERLPAGGPRLRHAPRAVAE